MSHHKIKVSKLNINKLDSHMMQVGMDWGTLLFNTSTKKATYHRF